MATPVKFTRETRFESRADDPETQYLVLIVRARAGAVSLRVRMSRRTGQRYGEVMPWTLNSHFKIKTNDWWLESNDCDVLEQGYCFGDTGYTAAEAAWQAFEASEDEGWKFLEDTYNEWRKTDVTT